MSAISTPIADVGRPDVPAPIVETRLIAIGRGLPPSEIIPVATALADAGVRAFEITLNSAGALAGIGALAAAFSPDKLLVGAGTVLDLDSAETAVAAGARFLVMPHTDSQVVAWARERGIPVFPGAFTPTEALAAWRAGASAVKLFPASAVGPSFVRELRGPFHDIGFVPTGGVTLESAPHFLQAGAVAVGVGSWLTGSGDPAVVGARAAEILRALAQVPARG